MSRAGRYANPFPSVDHRGELPAGSSVSVEVVESEDAAASHGFDVDGDHDGLGPEGAGVAGRDVSIPAIADWLDERFPP